MGKSEELLRLERDLNEQPELREKLDAEYKRIAEAGGVKCDGEVMAKAAAAKICQSESPAPETARAFDLPPPGGCHVRSMS